MPTGPERGRERRPEGPPGRPPPAVASRARHPRGRRPSPGPASRGRASPRSPSRTRLAASSTCTMAPVAVRATRPTALTASPASRSGRRVAASPVSRRPPVAVPSSTSRRSPSRATTRPPTRTRTPARPGNVARSASVAGASDVGAGFPEIAPDRGVAGAPPAAVPAASIARTSPGPRGTTAKRRSVAAGWGRRTTPTTATPEPSAIVAAGIPAPARPATTIVPPAVRTSARQRSPRRWRSTTTPAIRTSWPSSADPGSRGRSRGAGIGAVPRVRTTVARIRGAP